MKKIESILITGGTGFFGRNFVKYLIYNFPNIKRLVIFSRDEMKQLEMSLIYPVKKYPFIRYFIGDIRDKARLLRALNGIDIVVHAAALKQVPIAEYNPTEYIQTNISGSSNIIEACLDSEVKKVIALSTDKAASPINLYGATKLCSDKLFVAANQFIRKKNLSFSVVRYGNVMGSRGSVIPFFLNEAKKGIIPVTNKNMTRFNITIHEAIKLVLWSIEHCKGGEIIVPKLPSYNIIDLAKSIAPSSKIKLIGIRPGEKIHEEMITESDSFFTYDFGNNYAIINNLNLKKYSNKIKIKKINKIFKYSSENNKVFLNVNKLRILIKKNIDPNFKPL